MSELTAQHVLAVLFDSEDFPVAIPDRMRRPRSSFNGKRRSDPTLWSAS